MMDAATAAAVAALVVACLAFFIACAQVLQQYFQTGQSIRLCDSVVYGPMPGKGHRRWMTSQFRFRILYSVPRLCVRPGIWRHNPPVLGSFNIGKHSLLEVDFASSSSFYSPPSSPSKCIESGEASWVSFCRVVQKSCGRSVFFDLVEEDVDRCPVDLPNVPMQISLRDVVVMGLFANMECINADFAEGSLSMRGPGGSIISSQHPILGSLLRFIPRSESLQTHGRFAFYEAGIGMTIERPWIERTIGVILVAHRFFGWRSRKLSRRHEDTWKSYETRRQEQNQRDLAQDSVPKDSHIIQGDTVIVGKKNDPEHSMQNKVTRRDGDGQWKTAVLHRLPSKQNNSMPPPPSPSNTTAPNASQEDQSTVRVSHHDSSYQASRRRFTSNKLSEGVPIDEIRKKITTLTEETTSHVEDLAEILKDRVREAQKRQAERRAEMELRENNRKILDDLLARNTIPRPHSQGPLLLTYPGFEVAEHVLEESTVEQAEAEAREQERLKKRSECDEERRAPRVNKNRNRIRGEVDWFWISQINVFHGPWATPWQSSIYLPECFGGIAVFMEALLGFFDSDSILYGDARIKPGIEKHQNFLYTTDWMLGGHHTFPSYARNAQGGVIAPGTISLFEMPCFKAMVPALELFHSYRWQCSFVYQDPVEHGHNLNVELMRLDSWLSYVGRMPEIFDGRSMLLSQTPALVQLVIEEFRRTFARVEASATEGGYQYIQALAAKVMDFLMDEQLTEAEQVYVLVACLRTMKVARFIAEGLDTSDLAEILKKDVQVYLV